MDIQQIKANLCYYDIRNPDNTAIFGLTDDEIKKEGYGNYAKENCFCDNCFYGRTKLAEELLKFAEEK